MLVDSNDVMPEDNGIWLLMKSGWRLIVKKKKKKFSCEDAAKVHLDIIADNKHAVLDIEWCKKFAPQLYECVRKKVFEHVRELPWWFAY